jgi:hypothetical protein
MRYSIALTSQTNNILRDHLVRADGQEDVCYALWNPAQGAHRMSAFIMEPILPNDGDRHVHGNASTTSEYLSRAIKAATAKKCGIVFLHSHPFPGWQGMSTDDINTERRQAITAKATTGLPLVGMTIGTDGSWSGRFWPKTAPKTYQRRWCENVRVIGEKGLDVTFNDELLPPPEFREELKRTVSAWGEEAQQKLARLTFGVVGVGSVGSIVAESLARMGVQHIKLIDYDRVERHNLDRLLHATVDDWKKQRLKVDVVAAALSRNATAASPFIESLPLAITEDGGFREALDCDVLFSCVDRPWGRYVLNYIAYAYSIPVVDGGILIKVRKGQLKQASWRSHAVYYGRRCLECIGQYDASFVEVERRGDLDNPTYIEGLPVDHTLRRNENVFPFSAHLAASQIMHALHVVLNPVSIPNVGEQTYHFVDGSVDLARHSQCYPNCYFASVVGKGDAEGLPITGVDLGAAKARSAGRSKKKGWMFWR